VHVSAAEAKVVVRRGEPQSILREARDAWQAGEWERSATLLDDFAPVSPEQRVAGALLRARATLRAGQPARALAALDEVAQSLVEPDDRVTAQLLRGAALVALGRPADGLPLLLAAVAPAAPAHDAVRAEAAYELARAYWQAGRLDDAESALDTHVFADADVVYARALELYGWIEVRRERYPIAARHFLDALDALERSQHRDPAMHASLLYALVTIALETLDLKLFARVRRDIDTTTWSPGLHARWFALRRMRAVVELLDGNTSEAWRVADEMVSQAAPGSQRVAAAITAAHVARAAGDTFTPDHQVRKAVAIAADVDWASLDDAGRTVLLEAIREGVKVEQAAAVALLRRFEALPPAPPPSDAFESERGTAAGLEHAARAAVARAEGRQPEIVTELRAARQIWQTVGNRYAEARTLLAMLEVHIDDDILQRADQLTRVVPRSWLRRRYESLAERARGPEQLSPAERRVMYAICEGRSTADIAERFGRSKNTIRNQTRRVYEVMNVRTRSALVSKCASMGLLGESTA
jgi:DNA-binding CsgD family transcriptional regulator